MALFQPTNIIPSSLIGQGTVDVENTMEISWQVNGNSAMTAFQIDFYQNDTASTYVTSTKKIADGIPTNGFYGTDRFGNPQFFTYNANEPWNVYDGVFANGNEYKFKIIQWFNSTNNVVSCQPSSLPTSGAQYYFTVPNGAYQGAVVSFIAPPNIVAGATFYYSFSNGECWVESGNRTIVINGNINEDGTVPSGATQLSGTPTTTTLGYMFVAQNSSSIILTRETPTLTINQTSESYLDPAPLPSTLATSIAYFQAEYQQDQEDAIRWIRWQVAQATYNTQTEQWVLGEILADTGDIYTPTLNFEFNGFFNGQQYAIRCFGESESGQATQLTNTNENGWVLFDIEIENPGQYSGNFTAQCLNKENAVLLEWEGVEVIPPETSPEGYEPTILDGSVTLNQNSSVSWNKQGENAMNFSTPWTVAITFEDRNISGLFSHSYSLTNTSSIQYARFSHSGNFFGGSSNDISGVGGVRLYPCVGGEIVVSGSVSFGGFTNVSCFDFTFDDIFLVVGSADTRTLGLGYISIYKISSPFSSPTDVRSINNKVLSLACSPISPLFIVGGMFEGYAKAYSYTATDGKMGSVSELGILKDETGANAFNIPVDKINFSKDGSLFVASADTNYFCIYSVQGENITFLQKVSVSAPVLSHTISPSGEILVVGVLNGGLLVYVKQENGNFTYSYQLNSEQVKNAKSISYSNSEGLFSVVNNQNNVYALWGNKNFGAISGNAIFSSATTESAYGSLFFPNTKNLIVYGDISSIGNVYDYSNLIYGKILGLNKNQIVLYKSVDSYIFTIDEEPQKTIPISITGECKVTFFLSQEYMSFFISQDGSPLTQETQPISFLEAKDSIGEVFISGGETGITFNSVSVYQGDGSNILPLYHKDPDFEPIWNDENYRLYMTANFNNNLEGGTGTTSGEGFRIYRQEVGATVLTPIATVSSATTSLKDYGIVSRKAYQYLLYAYDNNRAFMSAVEAENTIATNFKNYSLLVCDYDQENDAYHVRKQYLFALNLSDGVVGNNNSPTLNANFTQYPTRMPSTQNYASGTLQGLIGAIYTVPALIEQIGQYKYMAKPSTLDYFDSVDLEQELYSLSVAPYQLFLRDMKGRLRMIATSGPIAMTTNLKQKQQSITISLPWVEVGDASDVTIIQTPDDYGWDNDNQVLDVQLDVDVATGELSAQYPFPYNGTKFYLTGVNKEILTAKTPLSVTPAQFELSDTAEQPDDGELSATVKVNSEDD